MRTWPAALLDGAGVAAFAAVGRRSHAEGTDLVGVLGTAWPFLAGCGFGWLVARAWRRPEGLRAGAVVWAGTLAGGIGLRLLTGSTAQPPFVVVASISLAVLLLGWRGAHALLRRARGPVPDRQPATAGGTLPRQRRST